MEICIQYFDLHIPVPSHGVFEWHVCWLFTYYLYFSLTCQRTSCDLWICGYVDQWTFMGIHIRSSDENAQDAPPHDAMQSPYSRHRRHDGPATRHVWPTMLDQPRRHTWHPRPFNRRHTATMLELPPHDNVTCPIHRLFLDHKIPWQRNIPIHIYSFFISYNWWIRGHYFAWGTPMNFNVI